MSQKKLNSKELIYAIKGAMEHQRVKFCFLLGAGASVASGIPLGSELAKKWYNEIKEYKDEVDFNEWKESKKILESNLASFYPKIYEERFGACKELGYAEIQKIFANAEPSVGYAYFAKLLAESGNRFVVTTNFDTLIEDALFTYTKTRPLVCGHESLANFVNIHTDRPTIIKVHRDVLLNPISDIDGTNNLHDEWDGALKPLLLNTHMIVIGYNGNDGSLMNYLGALKDSRKPIYWCVRDSSKIGDEIQKILTKDDYIVKINGFDEFVIELCGELGIKIDIDGGRLGESEIVKNAIIKAKRFIEQLNSLGRQESKKQGNVSKAVQEILPKWWEYESRASRAKTSDEKEEIYKEGIQKLPNSHELMGNYALFLEDIRKDYNNAEMYYKKALELDPEHANNNGNYARFLKNIRKDYDNAEMYYKKALELDPEHANNNGNYAGFLHTIRKDYDNAEMYYKKALEIDPDDAVYSGNYGGFLLGTGRYEDGEKYIDKAFELHKDENDLIAELWFYVLAHFADRRDEARRELDRLLANGVRSIGWDFSPNIERAEKDGYPDMDELREYARKITATERS